MTVTVNSRGGAPGDATGCPADRPWHRLPRAYLGVDPPATTKRQTKVRRDSVCSFHQGPDDPFSVRVFNPDPETDGYRSAGTVVEINIDDSPFLLDSLTNEIQAHGLEAARISHPVIGVDRDQAGRLTWIGHARHARNKESVEHYELDRTLFPADLPGLERALRTVLSGLRAAARTSPDDGSLKRMSTGAPCHRFYRRPLGEAIAFLLSAI